MALPTIIQTAGAATTTATPASLTVTLAATQAGTTLLALFTNHDGGSSTVNPPGGGWFNAGSYFAQSNMRHRLYMLQPANNPGGITTVQFTLATVDSACCIIYEVANLQAPTSPQDVATGNANTGSTTPASGTSTPATLNELWLGSLANIATATLTPANLPAGLWTAVTAQASTNGTTNMQLAGFYALPGAGMPQPMLQIAGSLSASVAWSCTLLSFRSTSSGPLVLTNVGGTLGELTGSFFQGMIGG